MWGLVSFSFHSLEPNEFSFTGLKILSAARGSASLPVFDIDSESPEVLCCVRTVSGFFVLCSLFAKDTV